MMFYGQFNPPVDEVLFRSYFLDKRNGFFVECGAYDGYLECSCKFFEESMGWNGLNIEASPRIFERLVTNRPRSRNICVALSDSRGAAIFQDIVSPTGVADGNGSLAHKPEHLALIRRDGCTLRAVDVEMRTYREVLEEQRVSVVDLFVLDVEGCELRVMAGMAGAPVPAVLCVEHSFSGLAEVKKAAAQMGLRFDFTHAVNAFFSDPTRIASPTWKP